MKGNVSTQCMDWFRCTANKQELLCGSERVGGCESKNKQVLLCGSERVGGRESKNSRDVMTGTLCSPKSPKEFGRIEPHHPG